MTTKEVNKGMIGKSRDYSNWTYIKGTITGIVEDRCVKGIAVEHEPVHWGDQVLTNTHSTARKFDEFGSLGHAKLIEDEGHDVTDITNKFNNDEISADEMWAEVLKRVNK